MEHTSYLFVGNPIYFSFFMTSLDLDSLTYTASTRSAYAGYQLSPLKYSNPTYSFPFGIQWLEFLVFFRCLYATMKILKKVPVKIHEKVTSTASRDMIPDMLFHITR